MINKSKLTAKLAIAVIAAASLASPSLAASPGPYGQGYTGGGSAGYNHHTATDYKLKRHHTKHHTSSQQMKQ